MRSIRLPALVLLFFVLLSVSPAQRRTLAQPPRRAGGALAAQEEWDAAMRERFERQAAKRWNKERHEQLKKDTDKLLELATQLKEQVDKSNENIMSLEVIRKAEEIEKLAERVREKMKSM